MSVTGKNDYNPPSHAHLCSPFPMVSSPELRVKDIAPLVFASISTAPSHLHFGHRILVRRGMDLHLHVYWQSGFTQRRVGCLRARLRMVQALQLVLRRSMNLPHSH